MPTTTNKSMLPILFHCVLIVGIVASVGCEAESSIVAENEVASQATTASNATTGGTQQKSAADAEATEPSEAADASPSGYAETFAAALQKAAAAKDAVAEQLSGAGDATGDAAMNSAAWATEMYQSLKAQGLTSADNTRQWLNKDWQQMGRWEYKVVSVDPAMTQVETKLNELGKDRWECIQIQPNASQSDTVLYLKRPAHSYLDHVPMKDLMHLLPLMGAGAGK